MLAAAAPLNAFSGRLATRHLGRSASFRADTPSTMTDAEAALRGGAPHGHLLLADHQTLGRGRQGRAWADAPGQNLLLSFVWRAGDAASWPLALFGVAVGVAEMLEGFGLTARLKWPNDVRLGGRKTGGMIAHASGGALVVGLGLNVNQTNFGDGLAPIATSMAVEAGHAFDRADVLAALLNAMEPRLETMLSPDPSAVMAAYRARVDGLGEPVALDAGGQVLTGTFEAVADDGALVLRLPDGTHRACYAGDVHLLRPAAASVPDAP